MQFPIQSLPTRFDVCDIEEMLIGSPWKSNPDRLAHRGTRPIAACQIASPARLDGSVRRSNLCNNAVIRILETEEFRLTLNLDANSSQPLNQQTLMLVLGKDQRVWVWADPHAHVSEHSMRRPSARNPEIRGVDSSSPLDHQIGDAKLRIKLERSCLHGERTRSRSRFGCLVDDPDSHTQPGQQQR